MMLKKSVEDFYIFGGKPSFLKSIHVGRPNLGNREVFFERLGEILDQKWLTNDGPYVAAFERRIQETLGVKHCVAMCNGTVALEIASRALELTGEVIIPSFTFVATAHALQWQEITPVFCDIAPGSVTIDPDRVESMITPRTTGILGVHLLGRVCDVSALTKVAKRHNLKLLFDACHAFGCSHEGRMVGSFGDAEVLSFHATKFINTFEGGAVVTDNDDLAKKIRLMKNFGFVGMDEVGYLGTNGKMNEVCAAMGLTSLESLDQFVSANYRNYRSYLQELGDLKGIRMLPVDEKEKANYQYIVVEVDEDIAGISRDEVMTVLHGENILVRRYFYPGCHNMEPYRSYFPHASLLLPRTEQLMRRILCLPTGSSVDQEDIAKIAEILRLILAHGPEIRTRLADTAGALIAARAFTSFREPSPFIE